MNQTIQTMCTRRSVRRFKSEMVSKEIIERIVTAGTYAPTGRGKQSPIILAITNPKLRNQLSQMNANIMGTTIDPFYGAPVVLVVLADKTKPTYLYDGTLVMGNLMNAAWSEGIGSCWIHRAKEEFETEEGKALLKKIGIEGDYEGIGHCVLGYPLDDIQVAAKRKEDYVVFVD